MKKYFLFLSSILGILLFLNSCKKDDPFPVAFRYTIVDSNTLEPLIGYHSGARYDPELFEFRMNVKADKDISYQIGQDSGAVFTIRLSNILEKNVYDYSYVIYDDEIFDTLEFGSTSPAPGYEAVFSYIMIRKLSDHNSTESMAFLSCIDCSYIDSLTIKN
ncbi:MAG TPA: hypothetical protein VLZ75_09055 [Chitinophagales bacterium]|nr:hypothetical protein [Chitinophagales bacterium]